jgi:glutamate--cysteine ligase
MAMSPILVAMSANSPIVDGQLVDRKSYRAHIWTDTDADRCGILPFAFETSALFAQYTQYALDVPMYFVARRGRLLPPGGRTFRDFMKHGLDGERPTIADWATHLTTLFPEARLKTYIEVRAADSQSPDLMLGTPALMKGLLYDADCLGAAWDVVRKWTLDERRELLANAARDGMQARAPKHPLAEYAQELTAIGLEGLKRQAALNAAGEDERIYLRSLEENVARRVCPADAVIESWNGAWRGSIEALVENTAYRRE